MKIVSITMVKNEVDIIESFVRYHLNIFDEMIILDNGSTDETLKILNNLIEEGLSLIVINDKDPIYNQSFKMSKLLNRAVLEFNADMVCVLDVDEFITSDYCNPRDILNSLDSSFYYWVKWITYVPTHNDNDDKFIPKKINYIRDESLEAFYKVIVPKEIVLNYDVELTMGNHDLDIRNVDKNKLIKKELDLKIAHFPLRSPKQCMSKILVGWPNMISINLEDKPWGWHWQVIFDKIKQNSYISDEDLENFAKYYALNVGKKDVNIYYHPLNIDFCENIEIKYDFDYNYLMNILENYEYSSKQIMSFKRLFNGNTLQILNQDYEVIKNSKLFDEEWYLNTYDLEDNVNPIVHYLITWRENMYDPAKFFSTEFYFKTHRDVANAGLNPFVHYIKYGKNENRKIVSSKYNDIKISIIIPVYNVEDYLSQCLDSVLSQDFDDFEVICVNDGSTDNSLNILEKYAKLDSRIKIISQINGGLGNARNTGLKHANGKYIMFIDSDDYISKESIKKIYYNAVSNNSDIVIFEFCQFDEDKGTYNEYRMFIDDVFENVNFNNFTFTYRDIKRHVLNLYFCVCFNLFKKEFLDSYNFYFQEDMAYEDVLFHVKAFLNASKISFLKEYVYQYRLSNPHSIMHDSSKIFDIIKVVDSVEEYLRKSSFFKEFETEFYIFKISQLYQYIIFWHIPEYFLAVKNEFIAMKDLDEFDINDLPGPYKSRFYNVLNSNSVNEI